jgi:hypothetical protein
LVVSTEAALRRAQLVEVDRQFCGLIARRASLARQVPAVPVGTTAGLGRTRRGTGGR